MIEDHASEASESGSFDPEMTIPGSRERRSTGHFQIGEVIMERYTVLTVLGQGAMGVVYKCFDNQGRVEVALKALPPELSHDAGEMEEVRENYILISKLVHQNIAITRNLEKDPRTGDYFLIMECVTGEDLRSFIRRQNKNGGLSAETIIPILRQVAAALDYAHSERIIHRDIKPGNIMISPDGKVKVLDFGLAAQIHTSMTRVSMVFHETSGTAPYMAPEQWRGRVQDAAADQYALAVMAYEMFAGHLPFSAADPAVLQQMVLSQSPEQPPGLSITMWNALKRAMSKTPGERYPNCASFVAALEHPAETRRIPGKTLWGILLAVVIIGIIAVCQSREAGKKNQPESCPKSLDEARINPDVAPLEHSADAQVDRPSPPVKPEASQTLTNERNETEPIPANPVSQSIAPTNIAEKHTPSPQMSEPQRTPIVSVPPQKALPAISAKSTANHRLQVKFGTVSGETVFYNGDEVIFSVESNATCYILVYVRQPDGSEVVIFPNQYNLNAKIPGNHPVFIPGTDKPGFRIVASPPFGTDEVHLVASTNEADIFKKAMGLAKREKRHFVTTRGLRVEVEKQRSEPLSETAQWFNCVLTITTKFK